MSTETQRGPCLPRLPTHHRIPKRTQYASLETSPPMPDFSTKSTASVVLGCVIAGTSNVAS